MRSTRDGYTNRLDHLRTADTRWGGAIRYAARPALTFDQFRAMKVLPGLDGMRAIAVLLTISIHYGGPSSAWLSGWLGVQMFFVLSGFIITTLLLREEEQEGSVAIAPFYIRRAFRILPAYAAIIAIVFVQTYLMGGEYWDQFKAALPYYLTMLNEFSGPSLLTMTWTIGIEWKFYLVWPALIFFLPLPGRRQWLAAIATVIAVVGLIIAWRPALHYFVLLTGAFLAMVMHSRRGFALLAPLMTPVGSILTAGFFCALHYTSVELHAGLGVEFFNPLYGFVVAASIPGIIAATPIGVLLSSPPMTYIGRRSYAMYLTHIISYQAAAGMVPGLGVGFVPFLVTVAVCLVVADWTYRTIEQPMIKIGHSISRRLSSRRATAPAAAG